MKEYKFDKDVVIEMIRAATVIATTEIRTIGSDYQKNTNFFSLALRDIMSAVETNLLRGAK